MTAAEWLPIVFAGLMGLSILIYVALDGYDLGVGMLLPLGDEAEKDRMVASIGPFWDANETWLVMAVGLLLVAFPIAHGMILTALYLPVALMLLGLILRGVSFEFRMKVAPENKRAWNRAFFAGSLLTALSQGYMLGVYILGLRSDWEAVLFGALTALCVAAGYAMVGAAWLILKTDGALQRRAVGWMRTALAPVALGMAAISIASPLASERIFEKWFSLPELILLAPLPLLTGGLLIGLWLLLAHMPLKGDGFAWAPFAGATAIFVLAFFGLAYSFYPYVAPERLTIYEAAAAPESLAIILAGTLFVLPVIIGYTIFSYYVFRGKATDLRYD